MCIRIPHIRNTTSLFISPCVCSLCQRLVHIFLHHSSELQKPQRWCFSLLVWSSLRPWEGNNCLDPSNSCFIRNGFCPLWRVCGFLNGEHFQRSMAPESGFSHDCGAFWNLFSLVWNALPWLPPPCSDPASENRGHSLCSSPRGYPQEAPSVSSPGVKDASQTAQAEPWVCDLFFVFT